MQFSIKFQINFNIHKFFQKIFTIEKFAAIRLLIKMRYTLVICNATRQQNITVSRQQNILNHKRKTSTYMRQNRKSVTKTNRLGHGSSVLRIVRRRLQLVMSGTKCFSLTSK